MLSKSYDKEGKIIGYIEWWQVTKSGFHEKYGKYIWVKDMWIHKDHRDSNVIFKHLIKDVILKSNEAEYAYFNRRKYNGRLSKTYSIQKWENWVNG